MASQAGFACMYEMEIYKLVHWLWGDGFPRFSIRFLIFLFVWFFYKYILILDNNISHASESSSVFCLVSIDKLVVS